MLRSLLNRFLHYKNHFPLAFVILICLIVTGSSYKLGTYLSGWDTLHPEFNPTLYTERVVFGAWQEHQGLGAPASQAHTAELPRLVLIWIFSLLLPQSMVRHAMFYSLYFSGVIGTYFFLKKAWFNNKKDEWHDWFSAIGALFFGLNLGTLQHFYVPLEMFAVHFATLPWLLLTIWKYLKKPNRKLLLWFFVIQFFSAPSAHTATLFYMYTAIVFLFALLFNIMGQWKNKKRAIKPVLTLFLVTIAAHSYWMAPNLYYILFHSDYVKNAKISRHFSTEAFWQNQAYGSISDILIFKNFLFNWKVFDFVNSKFIPLFNDWEKHLKTIIGYPLLFISAIFYITGIGATIKNFQEKKDQGREKLALLVLFLVPFFFLNNLNFPSEALFGLLFKSSSTFRETLRFPFTKFSIIFIFACSIYFAEFFSFIKNLVSEKIAKNKQKFAKVTTIIVGLLIILLPNLPSLKGNLVSSAMKVEYPDYYFEMFDWFNHQNKESRIVKLPIDGFFGWTYHDWPTDKPQGYQGAGFIWFGLPQPILDREFDRWVNTDEYFYTEVSEAVKQKNYEKFYQVLKKYNISWLLFDKTAINPNNRDRNFYSEFTDLIKNGNSISLVKNFGPLEVFSFSEAQNSWISGEGLITTSSQAQNLKYDPIFNQYNSYQSTNNTEDSVAFPFIDLLKEETPLPIETTDSEVQIERQIDENLNEVQIPAMADYVKSIPVNIWVKMNPEGLIEFTLKGLLPEINIGNSTIFGSSLAPSKSITVSRNVDNFEEEYIFALNDTFVFFPYTEESLFLGSFVVPTKNIFLSLYKARPEKYYNFLNSPDLSINNCQNGKFEPEQMGAEQTQKEVNISAKNRVACVSDGIFRDIPNPGLLAVHFDYLSETKDTSTRICIFENGGTGCLNSDADYTFFAEKEMKQAKVFETIDKPTQFNISYNLDSLGTEKQLTYANAGAEFYTKVLSLPLASSKTIQLLPVETTIPITEDSKKIGIKQVFSKESELISVESLDSLSGANNCGSSAGKTEFELTNQSHILSAKKGGIACESFGFNQLNPLQEYILSATATNHQGRELRLVISDYKNSILEEIFTPYESNTKNILLGSREGEGRIKAEFLGDSFGEYESVNRIDKLTMAPFPLDWVANIKLISNKPTVNSSLHIISHKKYFSFLYFVDVNNSSETPGVLQLSQSYDQLWLAYNLKNPFIYFDHSKVNSWENGWLIPPGNHKVVIYYLPQISIFAGIIILFTTFLVIFSYIRDGREKPNKNVFQQITKIMLGKRH